ncbi:7568_t:CDS:2 [Ambispora leptoticha]|uniref:7568_t:CDS:1 n=1 Tax=Ambispora leptoticha TaxID=144679 RepID=A0A9N9AP08_9GLOM|nr:7568_t:CDS:2 [Ambispora leptoticha]
MQNGGSNVNDDYAFAIRLQQEFYNDHNKSGVIPEGKLIVYSIFKTSSNVISNQICFVNLESFQSNYNQGKSDHSTTNVKKNKDINVDEDEYIAMQLQQMYEEEGDDYAIAKRLQQMYDKGRVTLGNDSEGKFLV